MFDLCNILREVLQVLKEILETMKTKGGKTK
jgi:hypothetical protein